MVKRSLKILAVTPAIPNGPYLFYYAVWTFIQNEKASTLTEGEAQVKLGLHSDMETTVYQLQGSSTPLPSILKNRKNVTTETVTSVEQVSDLIAAKTSVRVSENDLLQK